MSRPLTDRERAVLDALLAVPFEGVDDLRDEARTAAVTGGCDCGCPSIDFYKRPGAGMHIRVNAEVEGTTDGLFLYTLEGRLGGIEWVGTSGDRDPSTFPDPSTMVVRPA